MEDDLKLIIALMCMKETRLALSFTSKFWIFGCCTPKINPSLRAQNSADTMVYILFFKNNS